MFWNNYSLPIRLVINPINNAIATIDPTILKYNPKSTWEALYTPRPTRLNSIEQTKIEHK